MGINAMICVNFSEDEIQPLRVECQILAGDGRTLQVPELEGKHLT